MNMHFSGFPRSKSRLGTMLLDLLPICVPDRVLEAMQSFLFGLSRPSMSASQSRIHLNSWPLMLQSEEP